MSDYIEHSLKESITDVDFLNGFQLTNPFFINYADATGYLGNLGSALRTDYNMLPSDINLHYRENYYSHYQYNDKPVSFDSRRKIRSMFEYYRGAKKEQHFQFTHSQRLSRHIGFGIDYMNIISPAFYKREVTNGRAFDFYIVFETGNHKYAAFADYITNKTDNNINGGLQSDTSLSNANGIDVKTLPVMLDNAQWLTRKKDYIFKQQFNFKVLSKNSEASKSDSTLKALEIVVPQIFIHHDFRYSKYGELFTSDNDSDVWAVNYYDTVSTTDTASTHELVNKIYFQSLMLHEQVVFQAGANNQQFVFRQRDVDSSLSQTSVFVSGGFDVYGVNCNVYYEQSVAGEITETYQLRGLLKYSFKNTKYGKLSLQLSNLRQAPYIIYNINYNNHFRHYNNFSFINNNNITIDYTHPLFSAGIKMNNIKNRLYYNDTGQPIQQAGSSAYNVSYVKFNIRFGKFNWINDLNFFSSKDKDIIHVPVLSMRTSVFYDNYLFNNVMRAQAGFDLFFNTRYYADAFVPGLQQFAVQKNTETGNYPFVDFFASARIRTAKFFIKVENLGSGLFGKDYYITPHYPLQGRGFRFGLQWNFYN